MTTESDSDVKIEVRGERLTLMPERAAFWHGASTLLIADPHWGKAATFRASGIPVPSGTTRDALDRLTSAVNRMHAVRVILLGDLLHAKEGRSNDLFSALAAWRAENEAIEVVLVRGNHDRRAGDPPPELGIECVNAPHDSGPFILAHHPKTEPGGYVIAGHVHPGIRLYGRGGERARLPCFFFGKDHGILPAFGEFTGLADVEPEEGARVYAVANDRVVQV